MNGHNPLWGSPDINARGKIIENFIELSHLLLLNSTQPTYLSSSYGTFSALDLSICSSTFYNNLEWTVVPDLHSSDHFPILIKFIHLNPIGKTNPRWLLDKADWFQFTSLATPPQHSPCDLGIEEGCKTITDSIIKAAKSSIPITSGSPKRPFVPWFNDTCKEATKIRRKVYKRFQKSMTTEYKRQRAISRKTFNQCKTESWKTFVNSINASTSFAIVWSKIRKITSKFSHPRMIILVNGRR
ncbi:uncharacterized protein [Halyomorpha halys]|uniref:uncharacterized protein n=1 Tax=Halyomorpha halys TaxID=286706 RepID=UPI0034D1AEDA